MSDERRGCSYASMGCGCVLGLLLGLVVAGGGAWGWWLIYKGAVGEPLVGMDLPDGPLTTEQTRQQIDRLAAEFLQTPDNVGLVVGILKDGEQQVFSYGSTSLDNQRAPDGDTVFELASVGKTFTAAVLADMHMKQELSWDDGAQKFLPESARLPTYGHREITLLDLATHTSALPSLTRTVEQNAAAGQSNPWNDNSFEKLYRDLSEIELERPIGKQFEYSNLGMGLLGHVLELHAKMSYEELIVDRICGPLEMTSTKMTLDDSMRARLARPHAGGKPTEVWEDVTLAGAGSFLSTADDMLRYVQAHVAKDEAEIHHALRLCTQKRRVAGSPWESVGLAWHITSENAVDIVWHTGGAGGSSSYVAFIPQSNVGVVVFANSSADVSTLGDTVLYLLHLH